MRSNSYNFRHSAILLLTLAIYLVACSAPEPTSPSAEQPITAVQEEDGFTPLFDGKTLNGWRQIGGQATFSVDNGEILGVYGPGPNSFLRTEKTYSDFILKLEMRFEVRGNSGILFRAQQRNSDGVAYGYQYELDHNPNRGWSGGIYDESRRKWLVPLEGEQYTEARKAMKMEQWNRLEIRAVGGSIKTWLNGIAIADLADAMDLEGFIALQVHKGKQGRIRWRNIRIKELGAHRWDQQKLLTPQAWAGLGLHTVRVDNNTLVADWSSEQTVDNQLRSRLPMENFAIRFGLNVCDQSTEVVLREWRNDGGVTGLKLQITERQAQVMLDDRAATQLAAVDIEKTGKQPVVTITALGDQVTLAVNNQHIARVVGHRLPQRGIFSIHPARCGSPQFMLREPAWVDLSTGEEKQHFYQTLDVPPAPVLSPEQALHSFKIAPGFEIELVASEPLVEDPVAMAWDARGRLYVVEMRGYMPDAFGQGQHEPVGRVVRLEDTDADGRMDKQQVFLDKLIHPRAVAVVNAGVLIGEPPNLWLCQDHNDDGVCDNKRRLGRYGDNEGGSVEHRENALLAGLDNWLYNAKSDRRLRIEGGRLVEQSTLYRGQWGISQDNEGRLFYNTNSRLIMADLYPAEFVLRDGAGSGMPGLSKPLLDKEQIYSVRVNPGINRAYIEGNLKKDGRLNSPTAVSGLVAYRGDQFPNAYSQDVFIPEPAANAVVQLRLKGDGFDLTADHQLYPDKGGGQREFLASTDERFRPVDAKVGPDGALYVIDMYRGIIQDVMFLTEELREQIFARGLDEPLGRGRIWRIKHRDSSIRRKTAAMDKADIPTLIDTLAHTNGWQRDTAQRLLLARKKHLGNDAMAQLRRMALAKDGQGAIHALWTLQGLNQLDKTTVLAALNDTSQRVAIQALRAGDYLLSAEDVLRALSSLPDDAQVLRQQLVFGLRHHNNTAEVQNRLLSLVEQHDDDMYLKVAAVAAARGQEMVLLNRLLERSQWETHSYAKRVAIARLTTEAYRSLKAQADDGDQAGSAFLPLLNTAQSQQGERAWRQIAMLEGMQKAVRDQNFLPAQLAERHPVLQWYALDATDPLWEARRKAAMVFTWPGDTKQAVAVLSEAEEDLKVRGKFFYNRVCANCHGQQGQGMPGLAPALALSPWVTGSPDWLARIVLQGLHGPITVDGVQWNALMPGHASVDGFDDETAAGLLTYIRRSWGNQQSVVSSEFIQQVKAATADRSTPWTVAELQAMSDK